MTAPINDPVTVWQGQTLTADDHVWSFANADGSAATLTAAHLQVRALVGGAPSGPALLDLSLANGGLVATATAGDYAPSVAAATTAALAPGVYRYDLFGTYASGERQAGYVGAWTVVAAVTPNP